MLAPEGEKATFPFLQANAVPSGALQVRWDERASFARHDWFTSSHGGRK
jgi:hypothetical protein